MIKMLDKEKVYQQCKRKVSNTNKFWEETNIENKKQIEILEKKSSSNQMKQSQNPQEQAILS